MRLFEMQNKLESEQYPSILPNTNAIVDYIVTYAPLHIDEELVEEYFRDCHAILKKLPISDIKEDVLRSNPTNKKVVKKYSKQDLSTMPPIVIEEDGTIQDGHHRFEVAKSLGAKFIWCYVVIPDETN